MTRDQLAEQLARLDPGASLNVEESSLAALFGSDRLDDRIVHDIEVFALEHRCSFSMHEHGPHRVIPCFEKDDIF
ncbi:hypothetical protein ACFOYU_04075 [Microvirga sp. GCM10011540]|uniref:hypothetical protein n=1 Tax=Microvirga sp. GCM10011540 TaxID=3317338 RepID=UPI00362468F0